MCNLMIIPLLWPKNEILKRERLKNSGWQDVFLLSDRASIISVTLISESIDLFKTFNLVFK